MAPLIKESSKTSFSVQDRLQKLKGWCKMKTGVLVLQRKSSLRMDVTKGGMQREEVVDEGCLSLISSLWYPLCSLSHGPRVQNTKINLFRILRWEEEGIKPGEDSSEPSPWVTYGTALWAHPCHWPRFWDTTKVQNLLNRLPSYCILTSWESTSDFWDAGGWHLFHLQPLASLVTSITETSWVSCEW